MTPQIQTAQTIGRLAQVALHDAEARLYRAQQDLDLAKQLAHEADLALQAALTAHLEAEYGKK